MPSTPRSLAGIIAAASMLFMAFSAQAQITIDRLTAPVRPLASGAPGNDRQPAH